MFIQIKKLHIKIFFNKFAYSQTEKQTGMLNLLAITWDVSPFIFTIGDFGIRWYSLFFVAGIFPVSHYIMRFFK